MYHNILGTERFSDDDHGWIYDGLESHADKWRAIGRALRFKESELNMIQIKPLLLPDAPKSFLSEMLSQWLQWAPGDGRGSTGFASKANLHAALLKAGLGRVAENFSP